MDFLTGYVLPFLVILSVLVFVHEMGHYLVARLFGVRVEVFSIGFGRELFGWNDRTGTRWKVSLLPLGGYVKMFGDADPSSSGPDEREMTPEEKAVSFHHKSVGPRAAIVAAGPIANFLFAVLIMAGLFLAIGQRYTPAVVGMVQPESAAAAAGVQPGDTVIRIDGQAIERFEDMQQIVRMSPARALEVVVLRDGREQTLTVTPTLTEFEDRFGNKHQIGLMGVGVSSVEYRSLGPAEAVWEAARETVHLSILQLQAIGEIIRGTRGTDDLGGPLRIAQMSGQVAQEGVISAITFMALLSINLGLINLFPIPMLDGGHLMFYAAEAVRGRPLGPRAQEYGFRIGLALVLLLMIFVTYKDLIHLKVWEIF